MIEVPTPALGELVDAVATMAPQIAPRVPPPPAAELGRSRALAEGDTWQPGVSADAGQALIVARRRSTPIPPVDGPTARPVTAGPFRAQAAPASGHPVQDALRALPPLLVSRVLGALEMTVAELDPLELPALDAFLDGFLGEPPRGNIAVLTGAGEGEAVTQVSELEQVRPGAAALVGALASQLASQPRVTALVEVNPQVTDESGIASAHGAAWLAVAVATAATVLPRIGVPPWALSPPAVIGTAIGVVVPLLRQAPMPAGYASAVLARARAEYLLPRHVVGTAPVVGHRLALVESGGVPEVDFTDNGLVTVVPGGAVIRAGGTDRAVRVRVDVLDGPPQEVSPGWDEIVEVSWRARIGGASVVGPDASDPLLRRVTPPWPGDYRLRVHACGRDGADDVGEERYQLTVWSAPAAREVVYARADRLGHRLRGEPEPPPPERPEAAYRWLLQTRLGPAATITVATGVTVAEVVRAFGADPTMPQPMRLIHGGLSPVGPLITWVQVLGLGHAVLAVEENGWQGAERSVLSLVSARGRAASMYWNINALTRLSFAERGEVLWSEEPFRTPRTPSLDETVLSGLDFGDWRRSRRRMGLVAVERFTGRAVTAEDLARIDVARVGFRIVVHPPARS